jgi:hypothetical protein
MGIPHPMFLEKNHFDKMCQLFVELMGNNP